MIETANPEVINASRDIIALLVTSFFALASIFASVIFHLHIAKRERVTRTMGYLKDFKQKWPTLLENSNLLKSHGQERLNRERDLNYLHFEKSTIHEIVCEFETLAFRVNQRYYEKKLILKALRGELSLYSKIVNKYFIENQAAVKNINPDEDCVVSSQILDRMNRDLLGEEFLKFYKV